MSLYSLQDLNADFGVSCTYGGKAIGLTFAGESSFDLNDCLESSQDSSAAVKTKIFDALPMYQKQN